MHSDLSFPVKKLFIDDTPTAKLVRQVLGAISEFDKAMTVAKLRGARERKRREAGKCEGRKRNIPQRPLPARRTTPAEGFWVAAETNSPAESAVWSRGTKSP